MDALGIQIEKFLTAPSFAVFGASDDPHKYGHKVYACYLQHKLKAYPMNPRLQTVLGNPAYADFSALPEKVESISIITPPAVTEKIVDDAIKKRCQKHLDAAWRRKRSSYTKSRICRSQRHPRWTLFARSNGLSRGNARIAPQSRQILSFFLFSRLFLCLVSRRDFLTSP